MITYESAQKVALLLEKRKQTDRAETLIKTKKYSVFPRPLIAPWSSSLCDDNVLNIFWSFCFIFANRKKIGVILFYLKNCVFDLIKTKKIKTKPKNYSQSIPASYSNASSIESSPQYVLYIALICRGRNTCSLLHYRCGCPVLSPCVARRAP